MIIIGIDPDSEKHGVAVVKNDVLCSLHNLTLPELIDKFFFTEFSILLSIEDVCANNFIYSRNQKDNRKIEASIARSLGKCQQAQVELIRMANSYSIPYLLFPPQKGNWAKQKVLFTKATGWEKHSNEDQRSAAFFAFLASGRPSHKQN